MRAADLRRPDFDDKTAVAATAFAAVVVRYYAYRVDHADTLSPCSAWGDELRRVFLGPLGGLVALLFLLAAVAVIQSPSRRLRVWVFAVAFFGQFALPATMFLPQYGNDC